ncbi:MAG: 50S ribosomal protein L25 [Actinobacteria bacterium]|nr:50S ribosomal protein L25 [Actinomycetota bacterium]
MSTTLRLTSGRAEGSAAARRLRRQESIPAVLYGLGMSPVSVAVERSALRLALSGPAGANTILTLEVDGNSYPAVVKDMQRHPVRRTVAHVDFMRIDLSEELTVSVPVHLVGNAKAVLSEGGLVDAAADTLEIVTTPANMPSEIAVDVSNMQIGDVIRLSEITMPAGCRAIGDPKMPVVTTVTGSKAAQAAEAAPAEGAEGAEAAGETPAES